MINLLTKEIHDPANAYLFLGPNSLGKGEIARRFAAAVLAHSAADPADTFDRAYRYSHVDLHRVQGIEVRNTHTNKSVQSAQGIEAIRWVQATAVISPTECDRKVFLFPQTDWINEASANSFLKTLEEPPVDTVIILVAESEDKLLPTVVSRCQVVNLRRMSQEEIAERMVTEHGVDRELAAQLARSSGGRPGLSRRFLERMQAVGNRETETAQEKKEGPQPHELIDILSFWLQIPQRLTSSPAKAWRLAEEVLQYGKPLAEQKVAHEYWSLWERNLKESLKQRAEPLTPCNFKPSRDLSNEKNKNIRRKAEILAKEEENSLLQDGFEILASLYVEMAVFILAGKPMGKLSRRFFDPTGINPKSAVLSAQLVLESIPELHANLRHRPFLANLFVRLGSVK